MFNLVVPKHFYMISNPVIIIDKSSDRFEERWRCQCAYIVLYRFENAVTDEMTKPLAIVLHEKHALNRTGFGDVGGFRVV